MHGSADEAVQYTHQKNQEYQALLDQYAGDLPEGVRAEFYAGVDRFRTSEVDAGVMQEINRFFESALPH
jgi:hypothetical protein